VTVGVGTRYQADIPELLVAERPFFGAEKEVNCGLVWQAPDDGSSGRLTESEVSEYLTRTRAAALRQPVAIGSVLVVFIAELRAFRLCSVLDVYHDFEFDRDDGDEDEDGRVDRATENDLSTSSVRVFDGYEVGIVYGECFNKFISS
jgi:hypothetical protein